MYLQPGVAALDQSVFGTAVAFREVVGQRVSTSDCGSKSKVLSAHERQMAVALANRW